MKAVIKYAEGEGNVELRDLPEPKPDLNEVKIKVEAVGICGSDLHIFKGDIGIPTNVPFIIGHEFSGFITEDGRNVSRFQGGERVTAENSRLVCGHCLYCMTGNYNLCTERRATGYAFDGAYVEYCVVPEERVHIFLPYSYKDRGRVAFAHQNIITCFVQFCCLSVSPVC